jgi:MFS superfamily sulfate permease-like transporter
MRKNSPLFSNLTSDLPAGLVVFLVALPLCLGIALSSGAPLFSGIIAGIIGGIVIGIMSGSHTSVSGPAAGLTVIVLTSIEDLGSFEMFLTAVLLAGIFQIILGILKAGVIGYYFPTAVIKGMLAGIGIILIIKQLPYALGINEAPKISQYVPFLNDWEEVYALKDLTSQFDVGAVIITIACLLTIVLWEKPIIKKTPILKSIPGALLVVLLGIGLNKFFKFNVPSLYLSADDKVELPRLSSLSELGTVMRWPDFSGFLVWEVYIVAFTIAIIASLETLLSLEAADKIDPLKRISPPNRELIAQGTANILNGLLGGLPVTAVIVRSSANVTAGSRSKMSAIFHGFLLLASVLLIPGMLNLIPLSSLAAILLVVGYKLTKVSLFKSQAKLGKSQFLPFIVTIGGIVVFDLLIGIGLGMGVSVIYILLHNFKNSHFLQERELEKGHTIHITLSEEVSFLNKGALIKTLEDIPDSKHVIIDGSKSKTIDYDVLEVIENFIKSSEDRDIQVDTIAIKKIETVDLH